MTHDEVTAAWINEQSQRKLYQSDVLSLKKLLAEVSIEVDTLGTVTPTTHNRIKQAITLDRLSKSADFL